MKSVDVIKQAICRSIDNIYEQGRHDAIDACANRAEEVIEEMQVTRRYPGDAFSLKIASINPKGFGDRLRKMKEEAK